MKEIKIGDATYLLVEVPNHSTGFDIDYNSTGLICQGEYVDAAYIKLPTDSGQWQLIGRASELTEDDWRGIVEVRRLLAGVYERYTDYNDSYNWFPVSTSSGLSLLSSNSMTAEETVILKQVK